MIALIFLLILLCLVNYDAVRNFVNSDLPLALHSTTQVLPPPPADHQPLLSEVFIYNLPAETEDLITEIATKASVTAEAATTGSPVNQPTPTDSTPNQALPDAKNSNQLLDIDVKDIFDPTASIGKPSTTTLPTATSTATQPLPSINNAIHSSNNIPQLTNNPMPQSMREEIRAFIVPKQEAILSGQTVAQINTINIQEGQNFEAGDELITFNCQRPQAEYKVALHDFHSARHNLQAQVKLAEMQAGSALELKIAQENLQKTKSALDTYAYQVSLCSVKAPFAGKIHKLKVKPFEVVTVGQPMVEIVGYQGFKTHLLVPATWINRLQVGLTFFVYIDDLKRMFESKIVSIAPKIDPLIKAIEVIAEFKEDSPDIVAGMSGTAHFPTLLLEDSSTPQP